MSSKRWFFFLISTFLGIGLGLYYGWVISPLQYVDTTPSTLRADFRADYTLMVAETFKDEQNLENAARRLAVLSNQPLAQIASAALGFAIENKFAPEDIDLLQNLSAALQGWQPGKNLAPTPDATGIQPGLNQP